MPEPTVLQYSRDSVVAEKLEAIIVLGDRNSRIKDFFDLRHLAENFSFDRATLTEAYWESPGRSTQIRAFARRAGLDVDTETVREIPAVLRAFLIPILEDVRRGCQTEGIWTPPGPWR